MVRRGLQIDHAVFETVKPLMLKIMETMAERIPEPTVLNTTHKPNTRILIELRDEFLSHLNGCSRVRALRGFFNFVIILYDYDAPYRCWIDWVLQEWKKKDWQPMSPKIPYEWRE